MPTKILFTIRPDLLTRKYHYDAYAELPDASITKLMESEDTAKALKAMAPEMYDRMQGLNGWLRTFSLRKRFNPEIRGPYVIELDDDLTGEDMLKFLNSAPDDVREAKLRDALLDLRVRHHA